MSMAVVLKRVKQIEWYHGLGVRLNFELLLRIDPQCIRSHNLQGHYLLYSRNTQTA
jgi:hypothetical protein